MGPVRGKLTAPGRLRRGHREIRSIHCYLWFLFYAPATPALAEVCDKVAEDWNGFRVTAMAELLGFWTSPGAVVLAGGILSALISGNRALCGLAATALGLAFAYGLLRNNATFQAAQLEGCVGPLWALNLSLLAPALLLLLRVAATPPPS